MPTDYTHKIADGTDTSVKNYLLGCARVFGALIQLREAPADTPIPRRVSASTDYYDKGLAAAIARLAELKAMTEEQRATAAEAYNAELAKDRAQAIASNDAQRDRYTTAIAAVEAWTGAPEGIKDFALEQLHSSLGFDVSDDPNRYRSKPVTADGWFAQEITKADHDRVYYIRSREEEIERTAGRNKWLDQLWTSLEGME